MLHVPLRRWRQLPLAILSSVMLAAAVETEPARSAGLWPVPRQTNAPAVDGAISGIVIDGRTQRPLAGAIVSVIASGRGSLGLPSPQQTDALGRFVFDPLPGNAGYWLSASRTGYLDGWQGQQTPRQRSTTIVLGSATWARDVRIVLWQPAAISGTVTDETGEPVAGTYVRAYISMMAAGARQFAGVALVKTDDRGRYRIGGIAPASARRLFFRAC